MLIGLLFPLGACSGLTPSSERLRVDPPQASLSEPCRFAVRLPNRDLSQSETERFWIEDRRRLAECRGKQAGLAEWAVNVSQVVADASE